jgi:hypothetical protein
VFLCHVIFLRDWIYFVESLPERGLSVVATGLCAQDGSSVFSAEARSLARFTCHLCQTAASSATTLPLAIFLTILDKFGDVLFILGVGVTFELPYTVPQLFDFSLQISKR